MKICAVICEYDPFHNGHKYQLDVIREKSGCDAVLCLMSGNFTQRGEIAVLSKFARARHAVENGADACLELPAAFAVAPAELFAGGAVHLLSSIPSVDSLAFGCESGSKEDFLAAANATLVEDKTFKARFKENMARGLSYAKARTETALSLSNGLDPDLFIKPNNLLGVEYCRALLLAKSKISPMPIPRVGGGYSDSELKENYSSASAIRAALKDGGKKERKLLKANLPEGVLDDLENAPQTAYKEAALCALIAKPLSDVARTTDCSEGLENRLRDLARTSPDYDELMQKVVSKRYTLSHLKRILAQNLLGLTRKDTKEYLSSPLYYKLLCVKKERKEALLSALSEGEYPLIARKSDEQKLKKSALSCYETDVRANDLFNILTKSYTNAHETLFV